MKLSEEEKRMVYQIESTNQNAALNEIYMTWRYTRSQATKDTAENLLKKLRPPFGQGVYGRDPGSPDKLPSSRKGADHWGNAGGGQAAVRGAKAGTEAGYGKALENQDKGFIKIRNHEKVLSGNLRYDHKDREL